MFSKLLRLVLVGIIFFQIGCGLKTGEAPKARAAVAVDSVSCIKDSLDNLKKFLDGGATDDQIGSALECLQLAIIQFKNNIRGQDHYNYTPQEISDFIFKKFLKSDLNLTPAFFSEFMKFKFVLLGGNPGTISRNELDAIGSLIARLKPEIVSLNPHIKILASKWDPSKEDKMSIKNWANTIKDSLELSN